MSGRPKILITNDDGFESLGIIDLATALATIGDVTVVAPDRDRSGVGHSVSMNKPIRVGRIEGRDVPTYRCSGTPADCVVVGAYDLCGGMPSLVVSGINRGANLGDDINYSGTVAAAFESAIVGVPSIAISLAANSPEDAAHHWETATRILIPVATDILENGLPPQTLLNVNVPNVAFESLRGTKYVRQGRKAYRDRVQRREDPRGGTYFWLWGSFDPTTIVEGTDLAAVRDGYASITPISLDRTDREELARRLDVARAEPGVPAATGVRS